MKLRRLSCKSVRRSQHDDKTHMLARIGAELDTAEVVARSGHHGHLRLGAEARVGGAGPWRPQPGFLSDAAPPVAIAPWV